MLLLSVIAPMDVPPTDTFECAICWADVDGPPVELPCCGAPPPGSTTTYCKRCVEIICENALGGQGRCPTCREFIQVAADGEIRVARGLKQCACCNQARPVAEEIQGQPLCPACAIGVRSPLRYECERCHGLSRIPHPMYRYQVSPAEFGTTPWFCRQCNDFTNRRILPVDLNRVPHDDCPESWGRRDDWFALVREQRRLERRTAPYPPRGALPATFIHAAGEGNWATRMWWALLLALGIAALLEAAHGSS